LAFRIRKDGIGEIGRTQKVFGWGAFIGGGSFTPKFGKKRPWLIGCITVEIWFVISLMFHVYFFIT
jgi:hypothetical protein